MTRRAFVAANRREYIRHLDPPGAGRRTRGVGVFSAREQLLELKLQARTGSDHFYEADLEPVIGLAPVLVGGIPDPACVELQWSECVGDVVGRVDQPAWIDPSL